MLEQILAAGHRPTSASLTVHGVGDVASAFPVTAFAAATIGAAGLAVADLVGAPEARVDRRLASMWFGMSLRPEGWSPPPPWDPISGDYQTSDGWIRLHTNAPAHRAAALGVLGVQGSRYAVAEVVAAAPGDELEDAVVAAGGCAAVMRTAEEWSVSEPGRSVHAEPLIDWATTTQAALNPIGEAGRPLAGLRVLDLTRVLAGPVATRFLALLGADVLRIDPPWWDEPGVVPEVTLGKRTARLDLTKSSLDDLLSRADVLVHGYRPGALEHLGLDAATRGRTSPGLVDVGLDAYGWTGPWRDRRGFDSIVQMSTGIAEAGMRHFHRDAPTPLPVQALDHGTGYLMAFAVLQGLMHRRATGVGSTARLSLARTAELLVGPPGDGSLTPEGPEDTAPAVEHTYWGPGRRLVVPLSVDGVRLETSRPARALGSDEPTW
ncbi:CoA transferase [Cellulomonas sp. URHD0024]|uniref:CoA transferase n=1 Tax=Cellulomonas sp. URHD0024 TaxID=1302620 RepID=UPI00041A4C76|nr:CoA transferase [Cellulomonas sp. URHD0024]